MTDIVDSTHSPLRTKPPTDAPSPSILFDEKLNVPSTPPPISVLEKDAPPKDTIQPILSELSVAPLPEPHFSVDSIENDADSNTDSPQHTPVEEAEPHIPNREVSSAAHTALPHPNELNSSPDAHSDAKKENFTSNSLPSVDIPCMRCSLVVDSSGGHVLAGQWGMSSTAHTIPGQTSPFELRLVHPKLGAPTHPVPASGTYNGFFMLQQGSDKPLLKVDEKQVQLTFTKPADGSMFVVQGGGRNRFGQFQITGTFDPQHSAVELFRVYQQKKRPATTKIGGRTRKQKQLPTSDSHPTQGGKTLKGLTETMKGDDGASGRSQRSSRGDWKDKADLPKKTPPVSKSSKGVKGRGKGTKGTKSSEPEQNVSTVNSVTPLGHLPSSLADGTLSKAGRVRRLPSHLQEWDDRPRPSDQIRKCSQILKSLMGMPSAVWFNQPVDPVELKIPDYPRIISEPMDFLTIKTNLETGVVGSPEEFRDAMLLVFRNAMIYNTNKDNVVHIAAKALQQTFEEKYRAGIIEPSLRQVYVPQDPLNTKKKPTKTKLGRTRAGPRSTTKSVAPTTGMVPISQMQELQRQMKAMQEKIDMLQQQTLPEVGFEPPHELVPLSEQEKINLSEAVKNLDPERLPRVLEIINEQLADVSTQGQGEIEIDMSALDTPTLRRLECYVDTCSKKRKPKSQPSPGIAQLDRDLSALEAHDLGDDLLKRPRIEEIGLDLGFSHDLADGLGTDSEPEI